jgi:hypothetical protein
MQYFFSNSRNSEFGHRAYCKKLEKILRIPFELWYQRTLISVRFLLAVGNSMPTLVQRCSRRSLQTQITGMVAMRSFRARI